MILPAIEMIELKIALQTTYAAIQEMVPSVPSKRAEKDLYQVHVSICVSVCVRERSLPQSFIAASHTGSIMLIRLYWDSLIIPISNA